MNDIYQKVACCSYDIIMFTETWLLDGIFDSEIMDTRYVVYRRDRSKNILNVKTVGGGVLIAVSAKLESQRLLKFESFCDDLWVKLSLGRGKKSKVIYICTVYLPSPLQPRVLEHFVENTNHVLEHAEECLIVGDFNMNTINWVGTDGDIIEAPHNISTSLEQTFWDFVLLNNLKQCNNLCNQNNRILDLVLTTLDLVVISPPVDVLSKIDVHHPPIICEIPFTRFVKPQNCNRRTKLNFFKADYVAISAALEQINWSSELELCVSVDEMVDFFYSKLDELIKSYVPQVPIKDTKYPYWFSRQLIKRLNEKNRLRLRVKKYNNPMDIITLDLLGKRCDRMATACYNAYIADIEEKITSNPKYFWSYLKIKRGGTSNYPSSMTDGISTSNNIDDICNYFASHFSKVYSSDVNSVHVGVGNRDSCISNCMLGHITITRDQIRRELKKIDIYKGAGPDGIPALFLNKLADVISLPLSIIFNHSVVLGIFPTIWKETKIVPIFKSGVQTDVSNYRPIAILSILAKVFEALICPVLVRHVSQLIVDCQYGFMKRKSTATNLVTYVERIAEAVDAREQVDAVYTDFSKAFDTVDHAILVNKLKIYGISEPLLSWFQSYLSKRTLRVVVNGCSSEPYVATSGIPQGSHLGPPMFILFINDIYKCFRNSDIFLFADDLKAIKCIRNPADSILFQGDLDRLTEWCVHNKMSLNVEKCHHIKFTKKNNVMQSAYALNGERLEEVETIRDLGVQLDKKLGFVEHIDRIILKSSKMLGFVTRECKQFKKPNLKKTMYNSLVRSHLEYCSVVWSPKYEVHIKRIERLQKRFLWHLTYTNNMGNKLKSYRERLNYFKMDSLENRRNMLDLIFLKKLVTGSLNCPDLLGRVLFHVPHNLPRSTNRKLFCLPRSHSNLRRHCPLSRMCAAYNELDVDIDLFISSVPALKKVILTANC